MGSTKRGEFHGGKKIVNQSILGVKNCTQVLKKTWQYLWAQKLSSLISDVLNLKELLVSFQIMDKGGHGGRVVTLSPPTSEIGVQFPARPQWESW